MNNTITTNKTISFIQGLGYPVAMVILAYIIQNLGGSGIVPVGVASVITGILKIVEDQITKNTGNALFGMVKTPTSYSI